MIHYDFTIVSLLSHYCVAIIPRVFQYYFTSISLLFHYDVTIMSLLFHCYFTMISLLCSYDFTIITQGKRENFPREKGKGKAARSKKGKGKGADPRFGPIFTLHPDRAHARSHARHDTKRFPGWTHPPTSDISTIRLVEGPNGSWRPPMKSPAPCAGIAIQCGAYG